MVNKSQGETRFKLCLYLISIATLLTSTFFDTFLELGAIHPCVSITSDRLVQKAHREGWEVLAWTVNDSKDWQKVSNLRVDGIFTDDPRWAMTL